MLACNVSDIDLLPWFALYVKSRHEKNVAAALKSKGHMSFVPTFLKKNKNYKAAELPLFPGYVFCRIDLSSLLPVMMTPGVFSIVSNGRVPQPVAEEEMDGVQRIVKSGLEPHQWQYVAPGSKVRMKNGPLRDIEGVIVDSSQEKWLVVSVNLLQRSVAVKIDRESFDWEMVAGRGPASTERRAGLAAPAQSSRILAH